MAYFFKKWFFKNAFEYRTNGDYLGEKLQSVAKELQRAANLLMEKEDDTIRIFDEVNGRVEVNYDKVADQKFHSNGHNGSTNGLNSDGGSSNGSSDVEYA